MLTAEKDLFRYRIQKRVAISSSISILGLVLINILTGILIRDYTLVDTLLNPAVSILFLLGLLSSITSLRDWQVFRIIHVFVFLGYPIFHTMFTGVSPYDTSALIWSIYGIILGVQYRLLQRRFLRNTAIYLGLYLAAKLFSAARQSDFAIHTAPAVVIVVVLFTYLFWIVFAEEIKHYTSVNRRLSLERDKNKIFVQFGQTIAGVIHNLKSVMMSIEGYSDLLKMTDKSEWDSVIELQKKSAHRMLEMINNFMIAVRSYQRAEKQVVELNSLVLSAVEVLKGNDVLKHKIRISIELGEPDTIMAVPMEIMQVIDNLVTNAAESMSGTGRFDLAIRTSKKDDQVYLEVEDHGVGIPRCAACKKTDCAKCPHFSIGKTSKENGTGIGVVYIRQIMGEHGGTLRYQSELDKGTVATVCFPYSAP